LSRTKFETIEPLTEENDCNVCSCCYSLIVSKDIYSKFC